MSAECPHCKSTAQVWDGYCHRVGCEFFLDDYEPAKKAWEGIMGGGQHEMPRLFLRGFLACQKQARE